MRFPFFQQADSMDCGPTCLKMIARYYGRNLSLQSLRVKSQIGKDGVSLLGISEAAEATGFKTVAAQLNMEELKDIRLPAILHWDQYHFVVLYKIKRDRFFIADPGLGKVQYKSPAFHEHWISDRESGIALVLEPTHAFFGNKNEEETPGNKGLSIRSILRYLLPHKKLLFQLLAGIGVATLFQLLLPLLTRSIVDTGINGRNMAFIHLVLIAQLALMAGRMTVDFMRGWILLHISTHINLSILNDFLVKLMRLPVAFFDSKRTGDILQRMSDHGRIENFLTGPSLNILFSLLNLLVFSVVLAAFNLTLFFVFLFGAFLYSAWIFLFLEKKKDLDHQKFAVSSREHSVTIQLVQGMQEIRLNNMEDSMRGGWESLQSGIFHLNRKSLILNQWQQAGAFCINEGKNILITFLSATAVVNGEMTLGAMLAVQYMIGQLNAPVEQMIGFMQSWQNAQLSMGRLNEIHSLEDEEPQNRHWLRELPVSFTRQLSGGRALQVDMTGTVHSPALPEHALLPGPGENDQCISFRNIGFAYPGGDPVLSGIDLRIPKGKVTAIVGVSGSGKTTLLKLLLKFYTPANGHIMIGETPLSDISHSTWRSHCGTVMQESFIFSDTIARNIAVGREDVDMDKLWHAANMANLGDFIRQLPLGFNTKIGAEGAGISTGQKQRILIARAVYRDPQFILFDEATNSLDASNESIILRNLEQFFHGRTVVIVAHRLSTVKKADQVVVLHGGRIVEKGTHQELITRRQAYYSLVKNQLELGD